MKSPAREAVSSSSEGCTRPLDTLKLLWNCLFLAIPSALFKYWACRRWSGKWIVRRCIYTPASQHLSITQPQHLSQHRVSNTGAARCDLMIQCNQTLYHWQPPAQRGRGFGSNFGHSFFSFVINKESCMYWMLYCNTLPDSKWIFLNPWDLSHLFAKAWSKYCIIVTGMNNINVKLICEGFIQQ